MKQQPIVLWLAVLSLSCVVTQAQQRTVRIDPELDQAMSAEAQARAATMRSLLQTYATEIIGAETPNRIPYEFRIGWFLDHFSQLDIPSDAFPLTSDDYAKVAVFLAREPTTMNNEVSHGLDLTCREIAGRNPAELDVFAIATRVARANNGVALRHAQRYRELINSLTSASQQAINSYLDTVVAGTVHVTYDFPAMAQENPTFVAAMYAAQCSDRRPTQGADTGATGTSSTSPLEIH